MTVARLYEGGVTGVAKIKQADGSDAYVVGLSFPRGSREEDGFDDRFVTLVGAEQLITELQDRLEEANEMMAEDGLLG